MKVFQLSSTGSLLPAEIAQPVPAEGEILVRVHAAGVTPAELTWYPTLHTKMGGARVLAVPAHEFSGTIAALGPNATGNIGDEVFGMNDWFAEGAAAEYCVTTAQQIDAKPKKLSHAQAASVPISALTAWQGLFDKAKLQSGERLLIHGGSGGVGIFAIQIARRHGAHIITTASAANADFLRHNGAHQVIDYHSGRFEDQAKEIDVVFDTVGGETLHRSWSVLSPKGRVVTIASSSEGRQDAKTKSAFFIVEPNAPQLTTIAGLLDSGDLRPVIDAIVPFEETPKAYGNKVSARNGRGKVVISIVV